MVPVPVLGKVTLSVFILFPDLIEQVGQVVQVSAARSHPGIFWREDRHLLCLARLLHRMVVARGSRWLGRLSLWSDYPYCRTENLPQHKCKHFEALTFRHNPGMATLDENVIAQEVCSEEARK